MGNPWEEINLEDYENHMQLKSVMQIQVMNEFMNDQFYRYSVNTIMVLGIAGGNGLNHIKSDKFEKVYGVDINKDYLDECVKRYSELKDVFVPIHADLSDENISLPQSDLVIANLLIEYIGYKYFQNVVKRTEPEYVSCVIQVNLDDSFVSDSPYLHVFDRLDEVHHQVDREGLMKAMNEIEYNLIYEEEKALPNGKCLLRLDFIRKK